ncbi:hypothetical protein MBLNU457_g0644t1 [Dothideomycetes sp. NU457]
MTSDDLNPTGPSQPNLDTVYKVSGNPADKEPAEKAESNTQRDPNAKTIDHRDPSERKHDQSEATPTSVARGIRGAGPGEETKGLTHEDVGRNQELDAQQMAAPGEGKIASAVEEKPGATGTQPGLESDLDRKKAEQAPLREQKKEERKKEVDVAGVLGQTGGPANPVDKNNYPNSNYSNSSS